MLFIMMFKPHGHRAARMTGIFALLCRFKLLLSHLMQMNRRLFFLFTGIVKDHFLRRLLFGQVIFFIFAAFKCLSRENGLLGFFFRFFLALFSFFPISLQPNR